MSGRHSRRHSDLGADTRVSPPGFDVCIAHWNEGKMTTGEDVEQRGTRGDDDDGTGQGKEVNGEEEAEEESKESSGRRRRRRRERPRSTEDAVVAPPKGRPMTKRK